MSIGSAAKFSSMTIELFQVSTESFGTDCAVEAARRRRSRTQRSATAAPRWLTATRPLWGRRRGERPVCARVLADKCTIQRKGRLLKQRECLGISPEDSLVEVAFPHRVVNGLRNLQLGLIWRRAVAGHDSSGQQLHHALVQV